MLDEDARGHLQNAIESGGLNAQQVDEALERLRERRAEFARRSRPFALVMADIDHFKAVNDAHGHDVGDQVLCDISQVLKANLREDDVLARWGGEAFCIFLPGADLGGAHTHAKRVLAAIRDIRLPNAGCEDLHITASIGVAMAMPKDAFATVVKRADQALCKAKETGRDQIKLADGP